MDDQDHDIVKVCAASSFDSPAYKDSEGHQGSQYNAGASVGGVIGGLAVDVTGLLAFWYLRKRSKMSTGNAVLPTKEDDGSGSTAPKTLPPSFTKVDQWRNQC